MLEVTDLHAWYGDSHILHDIHLKVAEGAQAQASETAQGAHREVWQGA